METASETFTEMKNNIWPGMFHVTEKGLKIVGLRCYAISNETVQIVRHGCNNRIQCQRYFGFKLPSELIEKKEN